LTGDFPCLWAKANDTMDFYFGISCKFTEPPSFTQNFPAGVVNVTYLKKNLTDSIENVMKTFKYDYVAPDGELNSSFVVKKLPFGNFEFRTYNFYQLSDVSSSFKQFITLNHLQGSSIHFPIWFGNISRSFFTGNRLYVEVFDNSLNVDVESFFVDFTDLSDPGAEFPVMDTLKYIGIGTGIGVGVLTLGMSLLCFFVNKYGEDMELRKDE
jgi:hypothetical protein